MTEVAEFVLSGVLTINIIATPYLLWKMDGVLRDIRAQRTETIVIEDYNVHVAQPLPDIAVPPTDAEDRVLRVVR